MSQPEVADVPLKKKKGSHTHAAHGFIQQHPTCGLSATTGKRIPQHMVGMTEPTVKPQVLEASGKQEKGLFGGARRCTPRVRRRYQKLHVSRAGATRSRTAARAGATKGCTTGNAAALKPQYPEVLTMSTIPGEDI